jgi:hypothetical protein
VKSGTPVGTAQGESSCRHSTPGLLVGRDSDQIVPQQFQRLPPSSVSRRGQSVGPRGITENNDVGVHTATPPVSARAPSVIHGPMLFGPGCPSWAPRARTGCWLVERRPFK